MTARDAALAAQVNELVVQVDRLVTAVKATELNSSVRMASFDAGYDRARFDMRPAGCPPGPRRGATQDRARLSLVGGTDAPAGGAA